MKNSKDTDDLYIIASGGTGAKVAEATIHLCAAGLGPPNVHILLVDGDTSNGNRQRTESAAEAYSILQKWPWTVHPLGDANLEVTVFGSKVTLYLLTDRFDKVNEVGLLPQIQKDKDLQQAMSVLLDKDELTSDLSIGFAGRPNLGSLVMDRHLRIHFEAHPGAKAFIDTLIAGAKPDGARPRIAVVGSVFGGTGASLLPVARRCVEARFKAPDQKGDTNEGRIRKLRWAKIMQLPYFQPEPQGRPLKVNPRRHPMDTSGALWFYGESIENDSSEVMYLIASETPELRRVPGVDAGLDQANSAFFHEILAALAILDFHSSPDVRDGRPVRHYGNWEEEICALEKLPMAVSGFSREEALRRFGALLHLAAFVAVATGDKQEFHWGLFQYAKQARLTGWDGWVHSLLKAQKLSTADKEGPGKLALDYFGRLLLWATTGLGSIKHAAQGLHFKGDARYVSLHNTLCCVNYGEVCVGQNGHPFQEINDNAVARMCRLALAALIREDLSHEGSDRRGHEMGTPLKLVEDSRLVQLGIPPNSMGELLRWHDLNEADCRQLCTRYGLPELAR